MKVIEIKIKTIQEPGVGGRNVLKVKGGLFFTLNWGVIKSV